MVLRRPHRGGEKCFDGLALTDPGTGDHIPTQLFVGALRKIERLRPECKHFGFKSREGLSAFPRAKFVPAQPALQPGVNKLVDQPECTNLDLNICKAYAYDNVV